MMPNHEIKGDYSVNPCLSQLKYEFNSKIGNKMSFSYETKASKSLIPKRRMCLWCPITKRKEIIMWIDVYPNWNTNFNSRISNKRSFSYETKASVSLTPPRRMCLWFPIMKKKVMIMWIDVYPNWNINFNSKKGNRRSFYYETKANNIINPNVEKVFMTPNQEEKVDYFVNPCLFQLKYELQF